MSLFGIFRSKKIDDPDGVLDFWPSFSLTPPYEAMGKSRERSAKKSSGKSKPATSEPRARA